MNELNAFVSQIPICPKCKVKVPEILGFSFNKDNIENDNIIDNEIYVEYKCECSPNNERIRLKDYLSLIFIQSQNKVEDKKCNVHTDNKCKLYCLICHRYICDNCLVEHMIDKPCHKFSNMELEYIKQCKEHKLNCKMYCETCKEELCKECVKEHNEHKCEKMKEHMKNVIRKCDVLSSAEIHDIFLERNSKFKKICDKKIKEINDIKESIEKIKEKVLKDQNDLENMLTILYKSVESCIRYPNITIAKSVLNMNQLLKINNDKIDFSVINTINSKENQKEVKEFIINKIYLLSVNKKVIVSRYKIWVDMIGTKFIQSKKTFEALKCFNKKEEDKPLFSMCNSFIKTNNKPIEKPISLFGNTGTGIFGNAYKPTPVPTTSLFDNNMNLNNGLFGNLKENKPASLFGNVNDNKQKSLFDSVSNISNSSAFSKGSLFSNKKEEEQKQDNQFFFLAPRENKVKQEESRNLFVTPPNQRDVDDNKSLFNNKQNEFDEEEEQDSVSSSSNSNSNCYLFGNNSSSHAESVVNLNLSLARSNETNTDTIQNGLNLRPSTYLSQFNRGEEQEEVMVHVTRTGRKYHKAGCRYLWGSDIPIPLSSARGQYSPCSVCL